MSNHLSHSTDMKFIRLYYNKDCQSCARSSARIERWLDWRDRVEFSTAIPATGPLRPGEIAVEDLATGRISKGVEAFRQLCRHIPIYIPDALLLLFPATRAWLDRTLCGCDGDACRVTAEPPPGTPLFTNDQIL